MGTTIEVKFRGDGGEKYEGPERRGVKTERTVEDRVADEIHDDVIAAIRTRLQTGGTNTKVIHRMAPDGCTDPDDFRDEVVSNAVANIGLELALNAAGIDDGSDDGEDADPNEKSMPCAV